MRRIILFITVAVLYSSPSISQNKNQMNENLLETVTSFNEAIATRDIATLEQILHAEFRVLANRFNGGDQAVVLSRAAYLQMMRDEKIGGTAYELEILSSSIFDHTAHVEAALTNEDHPDMHLYILLVKNASNQWQIISDVPVMH